MLKETVISYLQLDKNSKSVDTQLKKLNVKFDKVKAEEFQVAKRAIYSLYYCDIINLDKRKELISILRDSIVDHVIKFNK